jgi:predicted RNase H-like HicB family nuclease
MRTYRFSVYVTHNGEGWTACCPEFPDCRTRGANYEEALANLQDLIRIFVEDGLSDDEAPPHHDDLSFTTLSLSL